MIAELRLRVVEVAAIAGDPAPHAADVAAPRRWFRIALVRLLDGLRDPRRAAFAGPPVAGATLPFGARLPGTSFELDPASAAASLGALLYAGAPGPVDAVAPTLAAADHAARRAYYDGVAPPRVGELFAALALAEAVRAALAADGHRAGDPWFASRVAGAAGVAQLLGADAARRRDAALAAALDGSPPSPATLRAAHDAGPATEDAVRRAAGENAARALRHALAACGGCVPVPGAAAPFSAALAPAAPEPAEFERAAVQACQGHVAGDGEREAADDALEAAVFGIFPERQARAILGLLADGPRLASLGVDACVARLVRN